MKKSFFGDMKRCALMIKNGDRITVILGIILLIASILLIAGGVIAGSVKASYDDMEGCLTCLTLGFFMSGMMIPTFLANTSRSRLIRQSAVAEAYYGKFIPLVCIAGNAADYLIFLAVTAVTGAFYPDRAVPLEMVFTAGSLIMIFIYLFTLPDMHFMLIADSPASGLIGGIVGGSVVFVTSLCCAAVEKTGLTSSEALIANLAVFAVFSAVVILKCGKNYRNDKFSIKKYNMYAAENAARMRND